MSEQLRGALIAVVLMTGCVAPLWAQDKPDPVPTAKELDGAAGDRDNHFGDSPNNPGPIATDLDASLRPDAIKKVIRRVADWQLLRAEGYFNQQWTFGTLYCGLMAATASTGDVRYRDAMVALGEHFKWDISGSPTSAVQDAANNAAAADANGGFGDFGGGGGPPTDPAVLAEMRRTVPINGNSFCLAQTYLELYSSPLYANPWMMQPTRIAMDSQIKIQSYPTTIPSRFGGGGGGGGGGGAPPARGRGRGGRGGATTEPGGDQGLSRATNPHHLIWWWCDALYMAPPAWSHLYKITGDTKYLAYLDHHWWLTAQYLYDPDEHLYYRDASFIGKKESNGKKVFWSRGEGWVMGGLARILQDIPKGYPSRAKYEQQFKEMAARIASLQGDDGLWRSGMLDPDAYVLPENSGSAFFTYALAWGVFSGTLDSATYAPVVAKAWKGLVSHIHADGRLDCVQQTGSGPAHYKASSSYVYGVGAFLLAGREVNRMSLTLPHPR